jgi:hypothetical protein
MFKFILPAIIVIIITIYWEKITIIIQKKFNIRINYLVVNSMIVVIAVIIVLLNF